MEERRNFKRESLAPFTELFPEDGGEPISGYPINMSRGGLSLEAGQQMQVGERVSVAVHFESVGDTDGDVDAGEPGTVVEFVQAEILRVDPVGERFHVSVSFVDFNETNHPTLYGVLRFIDE